MCVCVCFHFSHQGCVYYRPVPACPFNSNWSDINCCAVAAWWQRWRSERDRLFFLPHKLTARRMRKRGRERDRERKKERGESRREIGLLSVLEQALPLSGARLAKGKLWPVWIFPLSSWTPFTPPHIPTTGLSITTNIPWRMQTCTSSLFLVVLAPQHQECVCSFIRLVYVTSFFHNPLGTDCSVLWKSHFIWVCLRSSHFSL